jgi:hypothetical protein
MQIGGKIYWRKSTGEVILRIPHSIGGVGSTVDDDFTFYPELIGKDREQVGVIQLEYGQYDEDFASSYAIWVDPETETLKFAYYENGEQPEEPVYQTPLSEQVAALRSQAAVGVEASANLQSLTEYLAEKGVI